MTPVTVVAPPGPGAYKSESTALWLSAGITLGGLVVSVPGSSSGREAKFAAGVTGMLAFAIGPTTGHIYAGNTWNTGLKWRLGSLALAIPSLLLLEGSIGNNDEPDNDVIAFPAYILFIGSALTYLGATTYEIATAGRSVRRHNRKQAQSVLSVTPLVGRQQRGLGLVYSF